MKMKNKSIFSGTLLTVGIRWFDRFIGLISMFILARLLTPEDFGIVAIATLTVGLANVFLDLGVHVALIQNKNTVQADFDTAWTLKIIQTALVTLGLFFASPFIADFFQDERSIQVLYVLAFLPLINGLQNIGVVSFQKNMQFSAEFRFLVTQRLSGFIITTIAAWLLRSYWALVIGSIAFAVIGVIFSYIVHPMRPSFSLQKIRSIFSISQWMLLKNIGEYLRLNLHSIFVARWSSSAILGAYSISKDISIMPSSEILAPFNRVLFPAFAKVQDNFQELKKLFLLAQGLQALITVPMSVGLALVAQQAVPLILGEKWMEAIPFVQILVLIGIIQAIIGTSGYIMTVLGKLRLNVFFVFVQEIIFAVLILCIFSGSDALTIAWIRLLVSAGGLFLALYLLISVFPVLKVSDLFNNLIRPILGVAAMAAVLIFIDAYLIFSIAIVLMLKVSIGALTYVLVVLFTWRLSGQPQGAETYLIKKTGWVLKNIPIVKKFAN